MSERAKVIVLPDTIGKGAVVTPQQSHGQLKRDKEPNTRVLAGISRCLSFTLPVCAGTSIVDAASSADSVSSFSRGYSEGEDSEESASD